MISTRCSSPTERSSIFRSGSMMEAVVPASSAILFAGRVEVEQRTAFGSQDHVLGDREPVDENEVLVNHADPLRDRDTWGVDLDLLTPDRDRSFLGRVQAVEDAHQRRFTGAVLADQRVNLSCL